MANAESMFELTDLWCETVNINEYMHFTNTIHHVVEKWDEPSSNSGPVESHGLMRGVVERNV